MSKNSQAAHPFVLIEDVLVSRASLQRARRRQTLAEDARYGAKKLIKKATGEAEAIQREAFSQGYRDGVMAAAHTLLRYLDDGRQLARRLQEEIRESTRAMLRGTLENREMILAILEEWLHQHPDADDPLHLALPHRAKPLRARIDDLLEDWQGKAVQIDYHDHSRFLIRCGNSVAEFDPGYTADKANGQLLRQLEPLSPACKQFADAAADQLRTLFEQHFTAAASVTPTQDIE
ncbi:MAG: hypothetical protein JWP38_742 [Herbaspirillum sp.]|nr:hypothetical protein [Herbaspirillum sp.]